MDRSDRFTAKECTDMAGLAGILNPQTISKQIEKLRATAETWQGIDLSEMDIQQKITRKPRKPRSAERKAARAQLEREMIAEVQRQIFNNGGQDHA